MTDFSLYLFYFAMADKRIISVFKTFVEKVFLPNLKKTDPAISEWNKFTQLLNNDNSFDEVAQYVDSIGIQNNPPPFAPLEKREIPLFKKRTDTDSMGSNNDVGGFNPSKTFGGKVNRMMFMGDTDDNEPKPGMFGFNAGRSMEDNKRMQPTVNPQLILPGLERLCKTFLENQGRIENILNGSKPMVGKYT